MNSAESGSTDSGCLPAPYRILPHELPFRIPGFLKQARPSDRVLAPVACDCETWFDSFASHVASSVGRRFLPVCRMSDGEFFFLFGRQPPSLRLSAAARFRRRIRQALGSLRGMARGFHASTAASVSSGDFSAAEWRRYRPLLSQDYLAVLEAGVLGIHLSYGKSAFQEHYFPAIARWLAQADRRLTLANYVPFYFVYALLRGPRFREIIANRRLLVVHSATGVKRDSIIAALRQHGARSVSWLAISSNRSFADTLDLSSVTDAPDACLVGAGIGKSRVIRQLEPLGVPCIDAGYAFEVWADPDKQWDRPYMTPDEVFDATKVRFLSPDDRAMLGRT
ncbi:MAG: hypothetical protein WCR51_01490 [Planctomycetia bacterium]